MSPISRAVPHCAGQTKARQTSRVFGTRLVSSERAFDVAAPKAWNRLPVDIKSTRDTELFKKQLKTFLFHVAYSVRLFI